MKGKAIFLFMILFSIIACQSNKNEINKEHAIPVKLVHVQYKPVSEPITLSGISGGRLVAHERKPHSVE